MGRHDNTFKTEKNSQQTERRSAEYASCEVTFTLFLLYLPIQRQAFCWQNEVTDFVFVWV